MGRHTKIRSKLIGISVIAVFGAIIFSSLVSSQTVIGVENYLAPDDVTDQEILDFFEENPNPFLPANAGEELILQSVIDSDFVFQDSDDTLITNILDGASLPFGSEKFGVGVEVILLDSEQRELPSKTNFLQVKELSLIGENGELLDLGSFNVRFIGITGDNQHVDASGKFLVKLNGDPIHLGTFEKIGTTTQHGIVFDVNNKGETFTFTLADEPESVFITGTLTNEVEVIITDVEAIVGSGFDTREFKFESRKGFKVYSLKMSFDGDKIVKLTEELKAVSVLRSDSKFSLCTSLSQTTQGKLGTVPSVEIFHEGELLVKMPSIEKTFETRSGKKIFDRKPCVVFDQLPRNAELTFKIGKFKYTITDSTRPSAIGVHFLYPTIPEGEYLIRTPISQKNYQITCPFASYSLQFMCNNNIDGYPPVGSQCRKDSTGLLTIQFDGSCGL